MNLPVLDIAIILAYVAATLVVGFWISSRASKDIKSYFLGGNKLSWWQLGLSMISLIIGFLFTTWMSAKIYRTGILLYGKKVTLKEMAKWAFRKS